MASGELYFTDNPKSTCDILIDGDGNVPIVSENQEIIQSLKDEIESNMTQWYLGYNWGMKLLQEDGSGIFDKKSTDDEIQEEIQRVVSKNSNITSSNIISIERLDRKVKVEMIIQTIFSSEFHNINITF